MYLRPFAAAARTTLIAAAVLISGVYTSAAGLPMYNISGIAIDKDNIRAHGQDENLGVESFDRGNEFFYRYIKVLTSH